MNAALKQMFWIRFEGKMHFMLSVIVLFVVEKSTPTDIIIWKQKRCACIFLLGVKVPTTEQKYLQYVNEMKNEFFVFNLRKQAAFTITRS